MPYARRTDQGHAAIVKALRKVGCKVTDLSRVGHGCPDLVVRAPWALSLGMGKHVAYWTKVNGNARILLMEVKEPKGKLTADQEAFIAAWPETVIVRSVDEALAAVGVK